MIVDSGEYRSSNTFSLKAKTQSNLKNRGDNNVVEDNKTDYTDFFNEAHKNLKKTDYLSRRGIKNKNLAERFNLGFVETWKHSKAPDYGA